MELSIISTSIMNWWVNKTYLRQALLLPALFFLHFSCNRPFKNDLGIPANDPDDLLNALYEQDFNFECATVLQDSIYTSGATNVLIGGYSDEYFGKVEASAFMQAAPLSYPLEAISALASFDSLVFFFEPVYQYGLKVEDTAASKLKFQVRSLIDTIHPSRRFYIFDKPSGFGPNRDEVEVFSGKALNSRSLRFKANQLGNLWFSALKSGNSDDYDQFTTKVKPFSLEPLADQTNLLGIELRIRSTTNYNFAKIHFRIPRRSNPSLDSSVSLTLQITDGQPHYTHIKSDRQGTSISLLTSSNKSVSSDNLGKNNYMQMGLGIMSYIRITDLLDWSSKHKNVLILRAELEIKPTNTKLDLPPYLELIRANDQKGFSSSWNQVNNLIFNEQSSGSGYGARLFLKGSDQANYRLNLTPYITDLVKGVEKNTGFFVFHNPSQLAVNRLIFGDGANTNANLRLKIHYTMP